MRKKLEYSIFLIIVIISINKISYCKYSYVFEETAMKFTKDITPPRCTISYSSQEYTNENVVVTIESDKEIEQTSGFELSDDKKKLTKVCYVNESDSVIVKDLSGNSTQVEYSVSNIDKGQPLIIGVKNNKKYRAPVKLDFWDDTEIENISIDRYSDKLNVEYHSEFIDTAIYKNIDRNSNSITVHIKNHPLNTNCYKYYLNDKLYMISSKTSYTYMGLEKGTEYRVKIEAVDIQGNVLDENSFFAKTSYFEIITVQKSDDKFLANIQNIDKDVKKIMYSVNNFYNPSYIKWYEPDVNNNLTIKCENNNSTFYPYYMMNLYLYDKNENILDIVQFLVDFTANYQEKDDGNYENEINLPGNYQIKVKDVAGNETVYYIKVE